MSKVKEVEIHELNVDIIQPNTNTYTETKQGGSKIVIIGKPGTGKSTLIKSLLYEKQNIFPVGQAVSGTEDINLFFESFMEPLFVDNEYDTSVIDKFKQRQKIAKKHLKHNAWACLIVDDCTDDPKQLKTKQMNDIFRNGRHWKTLFILSLHYALDVPKKIRTSIDGTFILRNPLLVDRKILYENYASIIPTFKQFCEIMDVITDDFTALYIHNSTNSNDLKDCVFYYKARRSAKDGGDIPDNWKFGCKDYFLFGNQRRDPNFSYEEI